MKYLITTLIMILAMLLLASLVDVHAETIVLKFTVTTSSSKYFSARSVRGTGRTAPSSQAEVKKQAPSVLPMNEMEYIASKPHGAILMKIFSIESGMGVYDVCRSRGIGFNGIGLGESDEYIRRHGPNCFPTYEALWDRAESLLVDLGVNKSVVGALCQWNLGVPNLVNCKYYQKFISL